MPRAGVAERVSIVPLSAWMDVGGDPVLRYGRQARAWIFGGSLIGLLVGAVLTLTAPTTYHATVAIELSDVSPVVDLNPAGARAKTVTVDTDAQLVLADPVVSSVASDLGVTANQARRSLTLSARPLSRVLEIGYDGPTPEVARAGAQIAAEAFLELRNRLVIQPMRDYLARVEKATRDARLSDSLRIRADVTFRESPLETERRHAIKDELELPGPGVVVENASVSAFAGANREVPLASCTALGALIGLTVGVARASRKERSTPVPVLVSGG